MISKRKTGEKSVFRKTISKNSNRTSTSTKRKSIYFSGKLLSSKDLTDEQEYFRGENSKDIGKDKALHIFDLPKFASKYIGETEKNINAIFEKTKRMNGIMIFDEADALFGKRSRIKDSHDRYANIEVSYLLKKLEKYKGIMFVSSNFKKPTTKQFVAKIDYVICLPMKK